MVIWGGHLVTCIYCHPILYFNLPSNAFANQYWILQQFKNIAQLFKNAFHHVLISPSKPIADVRITLIWGRLWVRFTRCHYQFKCAVQIKKQTEHYLDITTHQPHPYSYNCNFFLFPYNSITLLKSQTKKYFTSMTCNIKPFLTR